MTYQLAQTGERYLPWSLELDLLTGYEHIHRYLLASQHVRGKRVVDISCGEGYGTVILAHTARSVVGIDIDAATIRHAQQHHRRANTYFVQADAQHAPLAAGSVDVVVSFETIEHMSAQEAFLDRVRASLREKGLLIISTPNPDSYQDASHGANPFHVRELEQEEFLQLLRTRFRYVDVFGQRLVSTSVIAHVDDGEIRDHASPARFLPTALDPSALDYPVDSSSGLTPRYIVAFCSDVPFPKIPNTMMIDTNALLWHSLIGAYAHRIAEREQEAHRIAEREQEELLATTTRRAAALADRLAEIRRLLHSAHEQIIARDEAFARFRAEDLPLRESEMIWYREQAELRAEYIASLHDALAEKDTYMASLHDALAEKDTYMASLHDALAEKDTCIASLHDALVRNEGDLRTKK